MENTTSLFTAQELEEMLGKKYFYRQAIYRMAEEGRISAFKVNEVMYLSCEEVIIAFLRRLAQRIRNRYPWLVRSPLRVKFDKAQDKTIIIYGFADDRKITADTQKETEEGLLNKLDNIIRKEVKTMQDIPVNPPYDPGPPPPPPPPPPPYGPKHPGFPPPHEEIMEALRRIEERLARIEEKLR